MYYKMKLICTYLCLFVIYYVPNEILTYKIDNPFYWRKPQQAFGAMRKMFTIDVNQVISEPSDFWSASRASLIAIEATSGTY